MTVLVLLWAGVSLLYLFSGLLIVLYSEEGIASIVKGTGKAEVITAITGVCSLVAAFFSYCAADRAARAAEDANIRGYLPDRIKARDALSVIWNILNHKCCAMSLDINNPDIFLMTENEIRQIDDQREAIWSSSTAYGHEFHKGLVDFYTSMVSELKGQQYLCDFCSNGHGATLLPGTQEKYLKFRERKRDEAFKLLLKAGDLLLMARNN